jgi:hypothetical protein
MLASGKATTEKVDNPNLLPEFRTSELCQKTGVWVERNAKYLIKFDKEGMKGFKDGEIQVDEGFYSMTPHALWKKAAFLALLPLRRELIPLVSSRRKDWGHRIGGDVSRP